MLLKVIDNFFTSPYAEREKALKAEYKDIEHNGLMYPGIAIQDDKTMCEVIASYVSPDASYASSTVFYRKYIPGAAQSTFIHTDALIGHISAIVWLSEDKALDTSGLSFWEHKALKWKANPTLEEQLEMGIEDNETLFKMIHTDGLEHYKKRWVEWNYVPAKFNRAVIFDSRAYHSRWPKEPIGTDINDCRLIKTYFITMGAVK